MLKRIKRLKIGRLLKTMLILVIVLISAILSYLLYREVKIPVVKEEKSLIFSYVSKPSIDYSLMLKPNSVYSSPSLGEGQYYLTKYVDTIQADFNYEFEGNREVGLKGSYEVAAIAEGYIMQEEKHITVWEKKFVLSPKTDFDVKDRRLKIKKSINVKLSDYNDFVSVIAEDSKTSIPLQLNICMFVDLKADTGKEPAEIDIAPTIAIPLDISYFSIAESNTKEESGSIEEVKKVQLPINRQRIIIYECILGALFLLVLVLMIFTEAVRKSPFSIQIGKIFKAHGSRLVALNSDLLAASLDDCSMVRSIDDLVKVSDEIGRPIMYEHSEDYKNMVHFYVLDGKRTYLYILKDVPEGSDYDITDAKGAVL